MNKTLLFVGGGLEGVPGIRLAKSMGIHTVVSDASQYAAGFSVSDDHLLASTYDICATLYAAREYSRNIRKIDGVISVGSDVPLTVATVANELGLPGLSLETARLASDKLAMKERFKRDGVAIPWFSRVDSSEHLRHLVKEHGTDLVLKPVDSRGARGVLRLNSSIDVEWAFEHSKSNSPTSRVMVEKFLSGPQISTESIVLDGSTFTSGFSDRNYEYLDRFAPHIIENGGQLPGFLNAKARQKVYDIIPAAAASLGVTTGVVKGDIVLHNDEAFVIEIATRLSGGYFCTHEIPINAGVDFVGNAIRLALGLPVSEEDLLPKFNQPVAQRYWFPQRGRIVSIGDISKFENRADVPLIEIRKSVGDIISKIDSHPDRAGVVITTGETVESAVALAEYIVNSVQIKVEPIGTA